MKVLLILSSYVFFLIAEITGLQETLKTAQDMQTEALDALKCVSVICLIFLASTLVKET